MIYSDIMTLKQIEIARGALFLSVAVGLFAFLGSFLGLTLLGLKFDVTRLHLLERRPYFRTPQEILWSVLVWLGSFGISTLVVWLCFHHLKKFVPSARSRRPPKLRVSAVWDRFDGR
jgi:hypothetical protein